MDNPDFLRTILANPADDAPRLVYSDWLDEHVADGVCPGCRGQYRTVQGWTTVESYDEAAGRYRWAKCHTCNGIGRVSNGYAERAELIRLCIAVGDRCSTMTPHENEIQAGCRVCGLPCRERRDSVDLSRKKVS